MYQFVKKLHKECAISNEIIQKIEQKFDVTFPQPLVEFYLQYNGIECYLSQYIKEDTFYQVQDFFPIHCSFTHSLPVVETLIEWDRMDGFVPTNMIPFAVDPGGDSYYCDSTSGGIYIIRSDEIDDPIKICNTFTEFLSELDIYGDHQ